MDLVEELRKLDEALVAHRKANASKYVIGQHETKKARLIGELINELASPPVQSNQSYLLIKVLLDKYFPGDAATEITDADINKLAALI